MDAEAAVGEGIGLITFGKLVLRERLRIALMSI